MNQALKIFQDKKVRAVWDESADKWWFSVIDVVGALTDSVDASAYWRKLKQRLKEEGNETVTNCHGLNFGGANEMVTNCNQLKMIAEDGKLRETDVADAVQVLRIIQSIPSKKAEPFKQWLAAVGAERLDEMADPEIGIQRMLDYYSKMGYSEKWITQRLRSIEIRKELTNEWDRSGIRKGKEYAILTDEISRAWSGMDTRQYKKLKDLKKESLRDNMTNAELVFNMLAELSTTEISKKEKPFGLGENLGVAARGGAVARTARKQLEAETGKPVVTGKNARRIGVKK